MRKEKENRKVEKDNRKLHRELTRRLMASESTNDQLLPLRLGAGTTPGTAYIVTVDWKA